MPLVQGFDLYLIVIVALIQVTRWFSNDRLREFFADAIAGVAFHLSHHKRRLVQDNLQNAFQNELSQPELERVTHSVFSSFWQEIFDWSYQDSRALAARAEIVGSEHLRAALAQGHGVILWESSSYGKRVVGKHLLHANGFDVTQIHAHLHAGGLGAGQRGMSRLLEQVILPYFDRRSRRIVRDVVYLDETPAMAFTRNLMQRLARNEILCVAIEGKVGLKHITLPFLNKSFPFATGMVNLAKMSGAPLIPVYCTPAANNTFRLELGPPLAMPKELDRQEFVEGVLRRQVSELDARIRQHPGWYWSWNLLDGK